MKNGKLTANLRQTYTSFLRRKNEANERHINEDPLVYGANGTKKFS